MALAGSTLGFFLVENGNETPILRTHLLVRGHLRTLTSENPVIRVQQTWHLLLSSSALAGEMLGKRIDGGVKGWRDG